MSQAKVTGFFTQRKRNRITQDEQMLLNKAQKAQGVIEAPAPAPIQIGPDQIDAIKAQIKSKLLANQERSTRARTRQQLAKQQEEDKVKEKDQDKQKEKERDDEKEKEKEKEEAMSERPKRSQVKQKSETTNKKEAKPRKVPRAKVNMAELKKKIDAFNAKVAEVTPASTPVEEAEKVKQAEPNETPKELPAFQKFADLASPKIDVTCTLTLPKHYSLLLDSFKGSDTIVKFLFNRHEPCTFLKLKSGIQNITKHTFLTKHLAQIKTVYDEAYNFKQQKMFVDFKNDYHLIVEPNLNPDPSSEKPKSVDDDDQTKFTPHILMKRLHHFKCNLFELVKKAHAAFLMSIGIDSTVDLTNIRRWHQRFDLDKLPDITESELPRPPTDQAIKCMSGTALLNIAKEIKSSRIQTAIQESTKVADHAKKLEDDKTTNKKKADESAEKKTTKEATTSTTTTTTTAATAKDAVLDKLKEKKETKMSALLEKIRNKEKQKAFESMVLNSDKEQQLSKLANQKEAIRFLLHFFQAEKKATLQLDLVCSKLAQNLKGKYNESEARDLIKQMATSTTTSTTTTTTEKKDETTTTTSTEASMVFVNAESGKKWLNTVQVRKVFYLQMEKSLNINDLHAICDKEIERVKKQSAC